MPSYRCTKRPFLLLAALLLMASLAWAEEPASSDAFFADSGGGCMLPDLSGMSAEQIAAASLQAGFQVAPNEVQVPACPVKFDCDSLAGCDVGPICAVSDIGQCCQTSGGPILCCIDGTIKVRRCPCECTGPVCSVLCASSTDVKFRCS